MANENLKPELNQQIPNGPLKTYPWLTTITPENTTGYLKLYPLAEVGDPSSKLEYAVQTGTAPGVISLRVVDDQGIVSRQFGSFQQLADSGYNFGFPIDKNSINQLKSQLLSNLQTSYLRISNGSRQPSPYFTGPTPQFEQGTQPAPAAPAAEQAPTQTPDSAASGPNSDNPNAAIDPKALDNLGDQLKEFKDENKFGRIKEFLKYPSSIDSGQDRILIEQIAYVTSGITAKNNNISDIGNLLGNRESQFQAKQDILGTVYLPIPNELSETNSTGWGESSLSTISAALMGNAAGVAQALANAKPGEVVKKVIELGKDLGSAQVSNRLSQYLTANAAASILKMGGINVDPEAYISRVTGTAVNPNLELLFNGPKLRQFGFTFKMTPRNSDEAKNIRSIVKFFKKGMAPRRSQKAATSVFLGTPNVFRLRFMSGSSEIGGIGKIKTCALVSCSVNYTPEGFYAAYDDPNSNSQPIATVLQLAFTELTPIYNDEYDGEGDGAENRIGPDNIGKYEIEASQDIGTQDQSQNQPTGGPQQGPGEASTPLGNVGRTNYYLLPNGQVQASTGEVISLEEFRRLQSGGG